MVGSRLSLESVLGSRLLFTNPMLMKLNALRRSGLSA